jgi:hypothetical protein
MIAKESDNAIVEKFILLATAIFVGTMAIF